MMCKSPDVPLQDELLCWSICSTCDISQSWTASRPIEG